MTGSPRQHRPAYVRLDRARWGLARRELSCLLAGLGIGLVLGGVILGLWLNASWSHTLATQAAQGNIAHRAELAACQQERGDAVTARDLVTAANTICQNDLARLRQTASGAALPLPPVPPVRTVLPETVPDAAPVVAPAPVPPRPRPRPFRSDPATPAVIPPVTAPVATPESRGASLGQATVMQVGDEARFGEGMTLRLIAVSRRNSGALCILGADGMNAVRVPSSKTVPMTYNGQNLLISATVQSADSCRISVQAR